MPVSEGKVYMGSYQGWRKGRAGPADIKSLTVPAQVERAKEKESDMCLNPGKGLRFSGKKHGTVSGLSGRPVPQAEKACQGQGNQRAEAEDLVKAAGGINNLNPGGGAGEGHGQEMVGRFPWTEPRAAVQAVFPFRIEALPDDQGIAGLECSADVELSVSPLAHAKAVMAGKSRPACGFPRLAVRGKRHPFEAGPPAPHLEGMNGAEGPQEIQAVALIGGQGEVTEEIARGFVGIGRSGLPFPQQGKMRAGMPESEHGVDAMGQGPLLPFDARERCDAIIVHEPHF